MSYAQHRKIIDADSHVIELDDFLHAVADEEHKDLIKTLKGHLNKNDKVLFKGSRGMEMERVIAGIFE